MSNVSFARYGIREQTASETKIDHAVEQLRLLGYAVVQSEYSATDLARFGAAFDAAQARMFDRFGGREALTAIDEHNTIRVPMVYDRAFLDLAMNPNIASICGRLIGGAYILNQQNGIANPGKGAHYNQGAYHRDLPYQHFISSRPLAINALFCLDPFTTENGATFVVPASHKQEAFPSDAIVESTQVQVAAPAGSFIVLDCMVFHSGGVNRTSKPRRAVNHVFTIPMMKQQIDIPNVLGETYVGDPAVRRLLGYDYGVPRSIEAYYAGRKAKA